LIDFAKQIWTLPSGIEEMNQIDICLIVKVSKHEFVYQCQPISICKVNYKILIKMMVNRPKTYIAQITSHQQTGFVQGRNISENIIIA